MLRPIRGGVGVVAVIGARPPAPFVKNFLESASPCNEPDKWNSKPNCGPDRSLCHINIQEKSCRTHASPSRREQPVGHPRPERARRKELISFNVIGAPAVQ